MLGGYKRIISPVITIFILGSLPVQAQDLNKSLKDTGFVNSKIEWLREAERQGDLQVHGFASQAYIKTSGNDVFGDSDKKGSFGFTEIGLNASLRILPRLQISAQALSRRAGKGNSGIPRLDYGFLDYRLFSHEANQFGLRVGRLKNPLGFYNDTRDMAFTRPSILLPQSIYFDRTRNLALSSDAVQLYGETSSTSIGNFFFQFGFIRPIVDDKDTELALLSNDRPGDLTPKLSYIGRGSYESNDGRLRFSVSGAQVNIGYDPGKFDAISAGSIQFSPFIFSAQYNTEHWSLTSEYALRHFKYNNFGVIPNTDFFGESYYFQGTYRFNPHWEGVLRYDLLFTNREDRDGKEFASRSGQPRYSRFAKDITVGLRWNITPEFMLRAEYHRVNGIAWLSVLDNPSSADTRQHWNLFSVQASYRF